MDWFTGLILYFLIWWTALFMVLPFGVKPNSDGPDSAMPGAPENPMIKQKVIATTLFAAVLWLIVFALISADIINFRELAQVMHEQDLTNN